MSRCRRDRAVRRDAVPDSGAGRRGRRVDPAHRGSARAAGRALGSAAGRRSPVQSWVTLVVVAACAALRVPRGAPGPRVPQHHADRRRHGLPRVGPHVPDATTCCRRVGCRAGRPTGTPASPPTSSTWWSRRSSWCCCTLGLPEPARAVPLVLAADRRRRVGGWSCPALYRCRWPLAGRRGHRRRRCACRCRTTSRSSWSRSSACVALPDRGVGLRQAGRPAVPDPAHRSPSPSLFFLYNREPMFNGAPATSSAATWRRRWRASSPSRSASPSAVLYLGFAHPRPAHRAGTGPPRPSLFALAGLCHLIPAFFVLAVHRGRCPVRLARPGPAAVAAHHGARWPGCSAPSGCCRSAAHALRERHGLGEAPVGQRHAARRRDAAAPLELLPRPVEPWACGRCCGRSPWPRRADRVGRLPLPAGLPAAGGGRGDGDRVRGHAPGPALERPGAAVLLPVRSSCWPAIGVGEIVRSVATLLARDPERPGPAVGTGRRCSASARPLCSSASPCGRLPGVGVPRPSGGARWLGVRPQLPQRRARRGPSGTTRGSRARRRPAAGPEGARGPGRLARVPAMFATMGGLGQDPDARVRAGLLGVRRPARDLRHARWRRCCCRTSPTGASARWRACTSSRRPPRRTTSSCSASCPTSGSCAQRDLAVPRARLRPRHPAARAARRQVLHGLHDSGRSARPTSTTALTRGRDHRPLARLRARPRRARRSHAAAQRAGRDAQRRRQPGAVARPVGGLVPRPQPLGRAVRQRRSRRLGTGQDPGRPDEQADGSKRSIGSRALPTVPTEAVTPAKVTNIETGDDGISLRRRPCRARRCSSRCRTSRTGRPRAPTARTGSPRT